MGPTDKTDPEVGKTTEEVVVPPPQPPPFSLQFRIDYPVFDFGLRVFLFSATVVALVVMVTAEETVVSIVKFDESPAFIYFVAALCVAGLHSLLTTLISLSLISKPEYVLQFSLHLVFWDLLMLGIVSAATGAAGSVAYISLRGNHHTGWLKVCPAYDKYCKHLASAISISLIAAILLLLLAMGSVCSLHRRLSS